MWVISAQIMEAAEMEFSSIFCYNLTKIVVIEI